MEEIEFKLRRSWQYARISRQRVIETMRSETPERVQRWAVHIGDKLFPVKQVFTQASGVPRSDFTAHEARDRLSKLGFEIVDLEGRAE